MAQGDLKALLEDARSLLVKDTEWYRTFLDIQPHVYSNSIKNVTGEIIKEIGPTMYIENKKELDIHIKTYMASLYERIAKTKRTAYTIEELGSSGPTSFSIKITPKVSGGIGEPRRSGNTLIYDSTGADPFKRIIKDEKRKALKVLLESVNEILGSGYTSKTFLDTGHEGLGVAEIQTKDALDRLSIALDARPDLTTLAKSSGVLARLKMTSKWRGANKHTTITVTDESVRANRSKATGEKQFKQSTKAALEKILSKVNWATQKGSDSVVQALFADLSQAAKKSGAKVKNSRKPNRSNSQATEQINYKATKTTTIDGGFIGKVTSGDRIKPEFDLSIISLINSRLPPAVRANMGSPALQNRSGRFSESVKIVGIEMTPQGFPSLVYTYQRAPYDIFDPVLGSSPWATPARDPKPLITKSIRDVTREMAIGRFYTRRQ